MRAKDSSLPELLQKTVDKYSSLSAALRNRHDQQNLPGSVFVTMNISIARLENELRESALLAGEVLLEQGRVGVPEAVDKNLWTVAVAEEEVEVRLRGKKVVEVSCGCVEFAESGQCGHLGAALLVLRPRVLVPPPRKPVSSPSSKLTTNLVLREVPHDELSDFVRQYARTNRKFALALKARFASLVSQADEADKYRQLLDSAISTVRKPDRSISLRGAQHLLKVIRELQRQLAEAMASKDYLSASYIARALIDKVTPLLNKLKGKQAEVRQELLVVFGQLSTLLQAPPAPSLITDLKDYIHAEYHRSVYRQHGLDLVFLQLMRDGGHTQEEQEAAIQQLEVKYKQDRRSTTPLLLARLTVLEEAGQETAARQLAEDNLNQAEVLLYALEQAKEKGLTKRVKTLAETGLQFDFSAEAKATLEETLLLLAEGKGDVDAIQDYALARFRATLKFKYYRQAQAATSSGEWSRIHKDLLTELLVNPRSYAQQVAVAGLYAEAGEWDQLLTFLEETASLKLLSQYGQLLLASHEKRLLDLYRHLLLDYAENHLGRTPAKRIKTTLNKLTEMGADELAQDVVKTLRERYPERHALMEELSFI